MALLRAEEAAHRRSAAEQAARFAATAAVYHGQPVEILYLPKFYTEEGYRYVCAQAETMWRILCRVTERYFVDADYRSLFGFPSELEAMILARPHYRTLIPVCRLDMFLNDETGDFKYCEFNMDGTSAMTETREMARTFPETLIWQRMAERYELGTAELFDSWAETFLSICAETGELPERPSVAVVDFLEKGYSTAEFEFFREAFERRGCRAYVCEIRDLAFDGEHLRTKDGEVIDAVYRRAVTTDIMAARREITPFLEAVRQKKVCLVGDICTQVAHDKVLFRVLHLPETAAFLTDEENDYIRAHVPYTAMLTPELARDERVRGSREKWIVKPRDSYGARGIYAGVRLSQEEWAAALDAHAEDDYVLQEFVTPFRTENFACTAGAGGASDAPVQGYSNMAGIYLYGGRAAGIYTRTSATEIISQEDHEHEMLTVVCRPRA